MDLDGRLKPRRGVGQGPYWVLVFGRGHLADEPQELVRRQEGLGHGGCAGVAQRGRHRHARSHGRRHNLGVAGRFICSRWMWARWGLVVWSRWMTPLMQEGGLDGPKLVS